MRIPTANIDAFASRPRTTVSPCFECGLPAFHDHLVVPARLGGTRTIPLCPGCFRKMNALAFDHPARTKAGIRAARARGVRVGAERPECRNLTPEARAKGVAASADARFARALEAYAGVAPLVSAMRAKGRSLQDIVERLNFEGHVTRRGRPWNKVQVGRVLDLLERGGGGVPREGKGEGMKVSEHPSGLPVKAQYTTTEVAILYGMSVRSAAKMIDAGVLPGHRLPGSQDRRVLRSAILAHVAANPAYSYVLARMMPQDRAGVPTGDGDVAPEPPA